jgi:hypothetical protein
VPDCDLLATGQNAECAAMLNANFGKPVPGAVYDPDLMRGWGRRENNWEFSVYSCKVGSAPDAPR